MIACGFISQSQFCFILYFLSILTPPSYVILLAACRDWNFCRIEEEEILPAYRDLIEGVTVALFNAYVQGSMDHLEYVTDPDLIPMSLLQHHTDMEC